MVHLVTARMHREICTEDKHPGRDPGKQDIFGFVILNPTTKNRYQHHLGYLVEMYVNTYLKLLKIKMIPHISYLSNGIALE
jgi:hypothetical protein